MLLATGAHTHFSLALATTDPSEFMIKKAILITGAGAVENAWQPILDQFKTDYKTDVTPDMVNSYLARLVYLMRFYATGTFPEAPEYLKDILIDSEILKTKISECLKKAQENGVIKARPELSSILNKFIFQYAHQAALITTNWDTVIDEAINNIAWDLSRQDGQINALHIHGSVNNSIQIYLPSEVVREPYRTEKDDNEMGTLHGNAWQAIQESNRTIIYGLSLDPLDAELNQTLAVGWSSENLEEIFIIDPYHELVANRVKMLLDPRYPTKLIGYAPSALTKPIKYL